MSYGGNGGGAACVLPFIYQGSSVSKCVANDKSQLWCSTTSNYDRDQLWGYCSGAYLNATLKNVVPIIMVYEDDFVEY